MTGELRIAEQRGSGAASALFIACCVGVRTPGGRPTPSTYRDGAVFNTDWGSRFGCEYTVVLGREAPLGRKEEIKERKASYHARRRAIRVKGCMTDARAPPTSSLAHEGRNKYTSPGDYFGSVNLVG